MPAEVDPTLPLPGLSPVCGKPVLARFNGGRLSSDGGVLVLAEVERRLGVAERLARCLEDPRAPDRIVHGLAEMIRLRALAIAAGDPDANDCDTLRTAPIFKMAVGRLPESGIDLCSQPTMSRLENLPGAAALKRMMAVMLTLFCDSFEHAPRRLVLDVDDTEDRSYLAGNPVLTRRVQGDVARTLMDRARFPEPEKIRRYGELRYGAASWTVERRVIARIEVSALGVDTRYIVTNLQGLEHVLYEGLYCARGQAENLIKAHKLHLASDRTSCSGATANPFRRLIHTAAYRLMHGLRGLAPEGTVWRAVQFDTLRLSLIKVAARVTEMVTRITVSLPTACAHQRDLAALAEALAARPP